MYVKVLSVLVHRLILAKVFIYEKPVIILFATLGILSVWMIVLAWRSTTGKSLQVAEIWIYPVKGCAGVPVKSAMITPKGLLHDRLFAVVDISNDRVVTQRQEPRLALICCEVEGFERLIMGFDGEVQVTDSAAHLLEDRRLFAEAVREDGPEEEVFYFLKPLKIPVIEPQLVNYLARLDEDPSAWVDSDEEQEETGVSDEPTGRNVPARSGISKGPSTPTSPGSPHMRQFKPLTRKVKLFGDVVETVDCGDIAANWLRLVFPESEGKYRLVRMKDSCARTTPLEFLGGEMDEDTAEEVERKSKLAFGLNSLSDSRCIMLANRASLNELNKRLVRHTRSEGNTEELPMQRFRPNIVVECEAFEEDTWSSVSFATITGLMFYCQPCGRCQVPSVDQRTGVVDADGEPTPTLKTFRTGSHLGFINSKLRKQVYFGTYLDHGGASPQSRAGKLTIGDFVIPHVDQELQRKRKLRSQEYMRDQKSNPEMWSTATAQPARVSNRNVGVVVPQSNEEDETEMISLESETDSPSPRLTTKKVR